MGEALASDGWEIAGEAGNGTEAIEQYRRLRPDVVTLDISMPDCNGLQAVRTLIKIDPNAKIVVVQRIKPESAHR